MRLVGAGVGAIVGVIGLRINAMAPALSIAMCAAIGGIVVFAYLHGGDQSVYGDES